MNYFNYIDQLRKTPGSNAKKEILREALKNPDFQNYVMVIYNYNIVFGVRKINRNIKGTIGPFPSENGLAINKLIKFLMLNNGRRSDEGVEAVEAILAKAPKKEVPYLYDFIDRDMKAGVNRSLINTVFKEIHGEILYPEFQVGLAQNYDSKKCKYPVFIEPKMDGMRVLAFVEGGRVIYRSRNGKEMDLGERFDKELLELACDEDYVFDGELMGTDFDHTMTQARRKYNKDLSAQYYHIFDVLTLTEWHGKKSAPYATRALTLGILFQEAFPSKQPKTLIEVESITAFTEEEMEDYSQEFVEAGYEGIILKQQAEYPFRGKKDPYWMKHKPFDTWDGIITGVYEGFRGKNKGRFGGFNIEIDGVVTNVGGGYSDEQRDEFWAKDPNEFIGKWAEVKGQNMTKDGKVRFPVFVRFRPDKE